MIVPVAMSVCFCARASFFWCAHQDAEVARQYLDHHETWKKTAKFWTETYAAPRKEEGLDEKVEKLAAMGFPPEACRKALVDSSGNEETALMALLG